MQISQYRICCQKQISKPIFSPKRSMICQLVLTDELLLIVPAVEQISPCFENSIESRCITFYLIV